MKFVIFFLLERRHRIHGRSDGKRIKQIITLRDAEIDASASSSSIEPQTEITSQLD